MRHMMQFNNYQTDLISQGDPQHSISARADLPKVNAPNDKKYAFGGIDSKLYSLARAVSKSPNGGLKNDFSVDIISGPTTQGQDPFSFSKGWANVSHEGLPDTYDYVWLTIVTN